VTLPASAAPIPEPDHDDVVVELLSRGELEVRGRLASATNTTLLARVRLGDRSAGCVYKPVAGERPLLDFPPRTLARREAASYLLSTVAGWHVVPPTVLRDGPLGMGSVQWWVDGGQVDEDGDPLIHQPGAGLVDVMTPGEVPPGWHRVVEAEGADGSPVVLAHAEDVALRRMAIFDVVANNADRKGSHVVRDASGIVFGIDHGLTFNKDHKLRTVLWGWAGQALSELERERLRAVVDGLVPGRSLAGGLSPLLAEDEIEITRRRAQRLLAAGRFPRQVPGRPAIPWPAF
jgi:uncharacterized repeat protein (TIGR03843 family)